MVLILDTLRADRLGSYGFTLDTSPELDALARDGVLFERTIAQSSWTRPSVASMLTSLHPRQLGIYREQGDVLHGRFETLPEILQRHGYTTLGATANANLNSTFNLHQGFDRYADSHVVWSWMRAPGESAAMERLTTAREIFDVLLAWVREHEGGPLYLQAGLMEVHEHVRTGHRSMIRDEYRGFAEGRPDRAYLQSLRQLSRDVGDFVDELSGLPGWEDAVFVVTSDHGEGLDDHPDVAGSFAHGSLLYESNLHVPLILHRPTWPASPRRAGARVTRAVRLMDLAPTLLDLVGIAIPSGLEGVSLLPLLDGSEDELQPSYIVAETEFRSEHRIAVYGPEWNYIENRLPPRRDLNREELQLAGGGENGRRTDRVGEHLDVASALRAWLHAWEERVPRVPPTTSELSFEERQRLEAIGYLDEPAVNTGSEAP